MSATNRGSERRPNDFYETPETVTTDFLFNHLEGDFRRILEPCAGSGKMVRVLRERFPNAIIDTMDIDNHPEIPEAMHEMVADFLEHKIKHPKYDLIFTNPPYSLAREIIGHALESYPRATIVMLLRVGFLESKKRYSWWQDKLPTELHILANRPSFDGKGNDATAYAWFVWRPGVKEQKINVIWGRAGE